MQRYIGGLWAASMVCILTLGLFTGQWRVALAIGITGVLGYVVAMWHAAPRPRLFGRKQIPHLWADMLGWRLSYVETNRRKWDEWTPHLELIRLSKMLRSSISDGLSPMFVLQVAADISVIALLTAVRYGDKKK